LFSGGLAKVLSKSKAGWEARPPENKDFRQDLGQGLA